MPSRSHPSILILMAAFVLAGAALLLRPGAASAQGAGDATETCLACHPRSFAGEVHGLGTTNPVFKTAWDEAGDPKECLACHSTGFDAKTGAVKANTVTCEACHSPIPADHPNQKMPVDTSNDLCGTCHNDTRFGWTDWKNSVHYKRSMTCSNCHDPHLPQRAPDENVSAVCEKCHPEMAKRAEHSVHAQAGVSCIACHLGPPKGDDPNHQVPDHSFQPVLDTCTGCHKQQMHDPQPSATPGPTSTALPPTPTLPAPTSTPLAPAANQTPFSTLDFTFLGAGLLGLGAIGGLALSPVLDWLNRLLSKPPR